MTQMVTELTAAWSSEHFITSHEGQLWAASSTTTKHGLMANSSVFNKQYALVCITNIIISDEQKHFLPDADLRASCSPLRSASIQCKINKILSVSFLRSKIRLQPESITHNIYTTTKSIIHIHVRVSSSDFGLDDSSFQLSSGNWQH